MKRVLIFLAVAALLAVSCNKEQGAISGDAARVTYTVAGPGQVATKTMTMGTIGSDYKLFYEVRLWDGTTLGDALTGDGLSGSRTVAADAWPVTVQFDLARGKQYKILFWAQSVSAPEGLFSASNLTAIGINYAAMAANNENCDAFSGADVITPSGATAASVTLRRPFALVNLGTSDAVQFGTASGGVGVGNVSAKLSGDIATAFNVATGVAGTALSGSFTVADAPFDASAAATLTVGTDSYNYLSAVYVLPLGESGTIGVEYAIKDSQATPADITSLKVTNVPVKANHRSNIVGRLLTGTTTYSITVDQAFTGDTNKNATPTFASITQLNAFFASLISTGPNDPDHGDIYPESVTVTAIPAGDATTITLPNDTLSVAISILAPYAGEGGLTIAYPTAEGAKHSNKVFFNMAGLNKLTANLPDTHLEVVSGSDIDLSDVHTSASTFVIQKGARVGTANIQQGNAVIAGAVETLNVPSGATADGADPGSDNAVHVFLEKESAVEKIVLASRTDVVVEQPKDHIDVEATEKKVAVYVNAGAANSTATAQNGGVIYVEANVPCTVTADGTSEAASTVIVNDGASGESGTVEIVATNGGAIDLTANDDCNVTSEGTSDTNVPSTVTVKDVDDNVTVVVETADDGIVNTDPGVPEGAVVEPKNCVLYTPGIEPELSMEQPDVEYPDSPWNYEVTFNGQNLFLMLNRVEQNPVECSFKAALANAKAGQVIRLTEDVTVGSLKVPADVSIDFAGYTLTAELLSCETTGGKFILKQSDHTNPYKVSFVGSLEGAEIRGGSYLFDPTDYTPNGVGVVIPGQGEYAGGYYVPAVPEPKVFYANNQIVQQLGGLTIGRIPGTYNYNGWVLMYNPDGQRYNPYNTIGIQNGLYAFQADFNENEYTTQSYENWYADYVIYYDKAVNYEQKEIQEWDGPHTYDCPTVGLWGSYGSMTYAILMGENVPANYKCPMLGVVNWGWEYWKIRSDVKTFLCGPTNHSEANVGTTATVELRLYKEKPTMEGINAPGFKDYITVGRYVHPLDNPSLTPATDGN